MRASRKDPYEKYTIADWKWEFLRRNSRYRRAYRAIERLKRRPYQRFFGFGRPARHFDLLTRLVQLYGLNPDLIAKQSYTGNKRSLPSPDIPAHLFRCSPIQKSHLLFDYQSVAEELPLIDRLARHEVIVLIDTRFTLTEILADLKVQLRPYLSSQREQARKYRDYLTVWDLRQQGISADEIASKLWPDKYVTNKRDSGTGDKGALIQSVYDRAAAAQELIDASVPPRKRSRKIKK
jgi:hypothetical protein